MIVITREDLSPGLQVAQSCHAVAQFCLEQKVNAANWNNNYLIVLKVKNKNKLEELLVRLSDSEVSIWREPDLNNEITSVSVLETPEIVKQIRKLKTLNP